MEDQKTQIKTLISALESDTQSGVEAEVSLIEIGASAVEALIGATKHSNSIVRYRAVWALGKIRDGKGFEAILSLSQDASAEVRFDAILALGELGDVRAIPYLKALRTSSTVFEGDRAAATVALSKFKNKRCK